MINLAEICNSFLFVQLEALEVQISDWIRFVNIELLMTFMKLLSYQLPMYVLHMKRIGQKSFTWKWWNCYTRSS